MKMSKRDGVSRNDARACQGEKEDLSKRNNTGQSCWRIFPQDCAYQSCELTTDAELGVGE
jgi:hypothetical protein